jgi:hypothetical protein
MANWIADRRLYLTEDDRVTEDTREARWLFAPLGGEVSESLCRRYGLGAHAASPVGAQHAAPLPEPVEAIPTSRDQGVTPADEPEYRGVGLRTLRRSASGGPTRRA